MGEVKGQNDRKPAMQAPNTSNIMKHTEASRVARRESRTLAWPGAAACVALGNSTATG